ncbi:MULTISPECIES: membrane protein insertion efficiency factor YidD [Auritidibacter]|uniref:Putative membrane protein insertion efficiency factor n=1 Tax=Auritidibacter ignavus TaxID=678932 RepID=A0AAJ6AHT8_9MICC|nr:MULTISPECIES: membrane protein insertion efficiency factor YidD [Auritidibacter]AXR74488.1 membrane protein insertion efficiency factor YidD [Auritidibacter sp. NML130574]PXA80680.1 membrane protein insertion efficiency factor YidD [Auritidibacter sp. NML120636]RMX23390.1 membrane protein insertion efficiency factor YidD [Auritidibacter ignavus]WGH92554.1 membrane protein insertion efficiency factor YidD [Auritidibacter ignavus]WHS29067.1 membrane protein insertion efficiency factor YidD [A
MPVESPYITLSPRKQWGRFRALPSDAVASVLIAYRAVISPLYGQVCRFFPSCSAYTLEAVYRHGAIKGMGLGMWRILRCHPWQSGGVDPVPPSHRVWPEGKLPKIIRLNHPQVPEEPGSHTAEEN